MLILLLSVACKTPKVESPTPPESPPEDTAPPCGQIQADPLRIDDCWQVVATPGTEDQADLFARGELLMGCEDELPPMEVVSEEGDHPAIVLQLDPSIAPEAYTIRVESRRIRITGADRPGLAWGLIDWLRSLDAVELSDGGAWRPDPTSALNDGPTVCSDYDPTCDTNESCNTGGAWTPVGAVLWHPQEVDNHPAIGLRLAFASFKGSQNATFLPTIWHSGLGSCPSPADTAAFWDSVRHCDAQALPDEDGYDPCDEVRLRLDTLLLGRFSHALDDGYNFRMGDSVQTVTGCDSTALYADARRDLEARGVQLIPTVYGQETRAAETPVGGRYIFLEEPAELWGKEGDATLSEGLRMGGEFTVCDHGGRKLLAMDCDALDESGQVSAPALLGPTYDTDTTAVEPRISRCDPLELCMVREGCWDTVTDQYGLALSPAESCTNPALRVPLNADGRWYVLRFRASVIESSDLTVKLVASLSDGRSFAGEFGVLSTLASEGDYLSPTPALDSARGDWALFSYVFRAPDPNPALDEAYVQINGVPGSLAMLDDIDLAAIDGQLRELDPASLRGVDCAEIGGAASAPLPVQPWYDADGRVSGALATVGADCLEVGDTVTLQYRSWSHFGLWPGHASRQSGYTYTADPTSAAFWAHEQSPLSQLRSYQEDGDLGEFLLISDLGGEARGLGRAGSLSPAEVLSGFTCMVEAELCEDCVSCDGMLRSWDDPDFASCECADATAETRLLLAGDMFTPLHNGGDASFEAKEEYQIPYGGPAGGTWTARRAMPAEALYLSWFHFDSRKDGEAVGGHEMVNGIVEDFAADGLSTIPVSAWDPDAQRAWAALALGSPTVAGVGHYGWGTDTQAARVMRQAGAVFWSPGWRQIASWTQSDSAALPGGDERAELAITGMNFEDSTMDWPIVGRWLRITGASASWSTPVVSVTGERVLARVYASVPAGCTLTATFDFNVGVVEVPLTPAVNDELRVWSFSADALAGAVALSLSAEGCAGGVLDGVALYASEPVSEFPYPLVLEGLEAWDSAEDVDARSRICGDGAVWECVNANTWE